MYHKKAQEISLFNSLFIYLSRTVNKNQGERFYTFSLTFNEQIS